MLFLLSYARPNKAKIDNRRLYLMKLRRLNLRSRNLVTLYHLYLIGTNVRIYWDNVEIFTILKNGDYGTKDICSPVIL